MPTKSPTLNPGGEAEPGISSRLEHGRAGRIAGFIRKFWKWTKRLVFLLLGLIGIYSLAVLVGMFPVNRDFQETENGIEIFVFSGAFHSDIILPIENSIVDWRTRISPSDFKSPAPWATHMAFGWGDKDFYINTPSWTDLKISTASYALLMPSDTVMHVTHCTKPFIKDSVNPDGDESTRSVTISTEQYFKLIEFISSSFQKDSAGLLQPISDKCYGSADAFYKGAGTYHAFRTCNCWVGDGLETAGIKTGWFTPLPKSVFHYFPE